MHQTFLKNPFHTLIMLLFALQAPLTLGQSTDTDEQEAPVWKVTDPAMGTPPQSARIDTRRGTWMSLAVSPDGKTVAFDLLGDLYTLPIGGGNAKAITSGLAWDMQPAFSPDGSQLAFTSDRDGGDNIWILPLAGGEPRAITSETFRLLNNPAFSPDGRHLVARKHFTTTRSLGTGELWLYDLRGGKGIALVERPTPRYQKELGEPVFSADGSGLYYSQNATPGDTFIYAQDSNKEVFHIKHLDLGTGQTAVIAGGPGGAVRPTPSPDGIWLAFVRRVRAQSRLFLKHLPSGAEHMIADQLDQDMQETWAVHGTYPTMAWTPNSKALLFWRNGGIWRADLAAAREELAAPSIALSEIPFRVADERQHFEAPRPTIAVAPERFEARMARWPSQTPDGRQVIFESMGKLYRRSTDAASEPARLTRDRGDHFELFPTISPDGRWVYYVTWDDASLGTVRRVSVRGGRSTVLSRAPGHYRELSVSPDGNSLLVRRATGGYLLTPEYSAAPGVYHMPSKGGDLTLVTGDGHNAHFADRNDRIYLHRSEAGKETTTQQLVSVDLDGHNAKVIAESGFALDFRVAPDGQHLLFRENYHVYAAALPPAVKPLKLGPEADAVPVVRLTAIGGEYPSFSTPARMHWAIGPTFKTVTVTDAFADGFEPPGQGLALQRQVESDQPTGTLALTNARIITMALNQPDDGVVENGTVLIDGNRLRAVGTDIEIPAGTPTIDLEGKTVLPGLIDIHAHGPYAQDYVIPQQNWSTLGHLGLGVTTIHDPSSLASAVFPAAEMNRAGVTLGPRIFSTGEIVYGAKSGRYALINSYEDALTHVQRLKAQGAISVKNYNQPRREQRQQVVAAARAEGMHVVAEGGALYHMDLGLVADGNTGIEHTLPQQAIYDDVLQFWRQTNVGFTPTLVVAYGGIGGENYWYDRTDVWKHPLLSRYVPPKRLQARSVRRGKAPDGDYGHVANARLAKQLADEGVLVHIGAHGQREGLAAHWEIWMMAQGGMPPLQALRTATIDPARYFGMDADIGSLEAGKLADLIVVDGNPLEDIRTTDQLTHIMLNGRLLEAGSLQETRTGNRSRAPFYWEGRPESAIR